MCITVQIRVVTPDSLCLARGSATHSNTCPASKMCSRAKIMKGRHLPQSSQHCKHVTLLSGAKALQACHAERSNSDRYGLCPDEQRCWTSNCSSEGQHFKFSRPSNCSTRFAAVISPGFVFRSQLTGQHSKVLYSFWLRRMFCCHHLTELPPQRHYPRMCHRH